MPEHENGMVQGELYRDEEEAFVSYIYKVGVELEGGWTEGEYPPNATGDGSVSGPEFSHVFYRGESRSDPGTIEQTLAYMERWYPQVVNATCGFHIHISLTNLVYYQKLMCREFFNHVLKEFRAWGVKNVAGGHTFWDRLDGLNRYCKHNYAPDAQAMTTYKNDTRYSVLNYCYMQHKTIELRLLPMFKQKTVSMKALTFYTKMVEDWLAAQKRDKAFVESPTIPNEPPEVYKTQDAILNRPDILVLKL